MSSKPGHSRTCELCKCVVNGGDAQWRIHTAGIKHRRNAASLRLFGEPGHVVVSAFEPVEAVEASTRAQAVAAAEIAAADAAAGGSSSSRAGARQRHNQQQQQQEHNSHPASALASQEAARQQLQQTQRHVCKHLAALVSTGSKLYREAGARFDLQVLLSRQLVVEAHVAMLNPHTQLLQQQQQQQHVEDGQGRAGHSGSSQEEARLEQGREQQQQQQPPPQQQPQQQQQAMQQQRQEQEKDGQHQLPLPPFTLCWSVGSSSAAVADAAVLPHVLGRVTPKGVQRLELTVPYQTFGHAAAATAAAIATFCDALATPALQSLTHLSLLFDCPDYNSLVGQNAACFERAHSQLWGHVVRTLRDALQFNCSLQELTLAAFPGQLAPDDLATLQTALTAGRQKLRSTVLLGTHAVVGAGSPLLLLPKEVVCRVLELAVPRQPCVLRLELPRQMLEEDSDSDSSDSSDSDSDTSDSSSSSSSDDDSDTSDSSSSSDGE